ncbi:hypothetical protein D3C79_547770 [compost metagenome]
MRAGTVGDPLDQARAQTATSAFGSPARGGIDRDEVVAVDAQRGNPAAHATAGEGGGFTARDGLEGGDRPLVVDHVEDHRRAVDVGEGQRGVEVGFGGSAVTDPGRGDLGIALDRRGHGPADRLHELGRQVAADGEEACFAHRVHDRQLAAFERVALVGQQLADHLDQRHVASHQDALLAIGREAHVGAVQGQGLGAADGFLAQALHVEGHLLLALGDDHAAVEDPRLEHGTHAFAQDLWIDVLGPWAKRVAVLVQHANQAAGQVCGVGSVDIDRGFTDLTGIVQTQVGKIGLAAWPACRLGHMQTQGGVLVHAFYARSGVVFVSFEAAAAECRFVTGRSASSTC